MDVSLYVYDLSHGLARAMSRQYLGVQIDAVYHTSIVFGNVEYFYGAGIQTAGPGSTHHGQPMEMIPLGETALPEDVIIEYLDSLRAIYTPEAYDLFAHNCNNFSNDFSMFLVGKGIPDHITSLPQTVLNTPFGQMLAPQIGQAMRPVTQAPSQAGIQTLQSQSAPSVKPDSAVRNVTDTLAVNELVQQAPCAVIFFTSSTCAPCKIAYPTYDELAEENKGLVTLIKVDINQSQHLATRYSIRATPTFISFVKGQQQETWTGANTSQLRTNVQLLVQMAHPRHPHEDLRLPTFRRQSTRYHLLGSVPPIEKLVAKMGDLASDPSVASAVTFLQLRNKAGAREAQLPDLPSIGKSLRRAPSEIPVENLFAAYDLLRLLLVDTRVASFFAEENEPKTLHVFLRHFDELPSCPYNLHLRTLQMACNIFSSPVARHTLLANSECEQLLVRLVANGLLDKEHDSVRTAAAFLAYNLSTAGYAPRQASGIGGATKTTRLREDLQTELCASLLECLSAEGNVEEAAVKAMVTAVGRLAYCAPEDSELLDLCRAMDASAAVMSNASKMPQSDRQLAKEVGLELLGKGLVVEP